MSTPPPSAGKKLWSDCCLASYRRALEEDFTTGTKEWIYTCDECNQLCRLAESPYPKR